MQYFDLGSSYSFKFKCTICYQVFLTYVSFILTLLLWQDQGCVWEFLFLSDPVRAFQNASSSENLYQGWANYQSACAAVSPAVSIFPGVHLKSITTVVMDWTVRDTLSILGMPLWTQFLKSYHTTNKLYVLEIAARKTCIPIRPSAEDCCGVGSPAWQEISIHRAKKTSAEM